MKRIRSSHAIEILIELRRTHITASPKQSCRRSLKNKTGITHGNSCCRSRKTYSVKMGSGTAELRTPGQPCIAGFNDHSKFSDGHNIGGIHKTHSVECMAESAFAKQPC